MQLNQKNKQLSPSVILFLIKNDSNIKIVFYEPLIDIKMQRDFCNYVLETVFVFASNYRE